MSATSAALTSGANVYVERCAVCHGTPGHEGTFAKWMYPTAPQLWTRHSNRVVGVSDDAPGVSFWKVSNGIRLTGMPAFSQILSQTEMWLVSLLLNQANQVQSLAIANILNHAKPSGT